MNIHSLDAELWWLANPDEIRAPQSLPFSEIMKRIQDVFGFVRVPVTIPPGNDGYKFEQGSLVAGVAQVVVRELVVYNAGVHISVAGATDNADIVFQKIAEVFRGMGVREPTTSPVKFYRSHIVCDFGKSIDALITGFERIAKIIQGNLDEPFRVSAAGSVFMTDPTKLPATIASYNPSLFTINRRTDVSFERNRYLCFANMRTANHLTVLEQIEKAIR